jgi:hypothetical protein
VSKINISGGGGGEESSMVLCTTGGFWFDGDGQMVGRARN